MKRVLMQKLIQAAGDMDLITLESYVKIGQTMAEKFPQAALTAADATPIDSTLWDVSVSTLTSGGAAHQLLVNMRAGPSSKAA